MASRRNSGQAVPPGVIARVVAGVRLAITGRADDAWFGPMEPLAPVAPEAAGRQFDYPAGFNLTSRPRAAEPISFEQLRGLARNYDLLRLVIETRKDQIAKCEWAIQPKSKTKKAEGDPRIKEVTDFLASPDREHDWDTWLRMLIEDMLVIDAATIYPRLTLGGKLYALEAVDGATIKRVLDQSGRTPLPPAPAYQQVLKGQPAVNYTREQLLYLPRNVRTDRVYAFPPVEQVMMTVNIALRRQVHQLQYYTEGNIPEALIAVPETWNPDQVAQFQAYWDALLEGDTAQRRHAKFVPATIAKGYVATKEGALKDEYDEWLARIVCYAFSVSNQAFVRQMNRSTSDNAQEQSLQEGLAPLMRWVKSALDRVLRDCFGYPDLEFVWAQEDVIAPEVQATINTGYVSCGVLSRNEVRADLGREPVEGGDVLLIIGQGTAVTVDSILNPPPPPPPPIGHNGGPALDAQEGDDKARKMAKSAWQAGELIDRDRPAIRLGRLAAEKVWTAFLAEEGRRVAKAVTADLGKMAKADSGEDGAAPPAAEDASAARAAQAASAAIDAGTWAAPGQEMIGILQQAAADGVKEGLTSIGIGATDVTALANPRAVAIAEEQGAKLVTGLVDTSRDQLRSLIVKAEQDGWSVKRLEKAIIDSHAFSPERAALIARHELARADLAGNLMGWRQARDSLGMEIKKAWIEGSEGHHCAACDADYLAGAIDLDDTFPSGADGAPGHPNCDCDTRAVFKTAITKWEGPRAAGPFDLAKSNPFHDALGRFARAPETGHGSAPAKRFDKLRQGIRQFINQTLHIKGNTVPHELGAVQNIARISARTRYDLTGYTTVLENTTLIHTLKHHGNPAVEARRNQVVVERADFVHIAEVMHDGIPSPGDKRNTIVFQKVIGKSAYTIVADVRTGARQLAFKTMWKPKP